MKTNYLLKNTFTLLLSSCTFLVTQAQNVGIGEANPLNAKLEVKGNLIIGSNYTGGNAIAQANGATIEGRTIIGEDVFYYTIDKFVTYGNTNHTATSATGPDNGNGLPYAVNGYTHDGHAIYGEDNDGGTGLEANVNGTSTNRCRGVYALDNSGSGFGVYAASGDNFSGYYGVYAVESSTNGWAVLGVGDIGATGGGFFNLSDARLKSNIKPISNALTLVNQLNPRIYDMKWEEYKDLGLDRTPQMGFLAQELETVLPNVVKESDVALADATYSKQDLINNPELAKKENTNLRLKMVNYVQLIPLLTQAIKDQQLQIEEMQKLIEAQNAKIDALTR